MRITSCELHEVLYIKKDYDPSLYESIKRRGLAFPIKVNINKEGKLECVDGHKRLCVLEQLKQEDENCKYCFKIPMVVMNNENSRSNDCWRDRNHH